MEKRVFPIWRKTMESEILCRRPPVKVISKWKAPTNTINKKVFVTLLFK